MLDNLIRILGQSNPLGMMLKNLERCAVMYVVDPPPTDPPPTDPPPTDPPPTDPPPADTFTWKEKLGPDLMNSPMYQKFPDTTDGLVQAAKSHVGLEQMLGHEKVPIPKGPDDTDGWNRFNKAMGVPDISTQYNLQDVQMPEAMKGVTFSKEKFAEVVHAHKATPAQAQGLWKAYTEMAMESYQKHVKAGQDMLTDTVNKLRGEWGDAYNGNVELGQLVINKFSADQDMNDWLTETLAAHPFGSKFLSQIGHQFSENKIGEFKYQNFSFTPEDAQTKITEIKNDPNHAYNSEKASPQEHNAAIDYVNSLIAIVQKGKQG